MIPYLGHGNFHNLASVTFRLNLNLFRRQLISIFCFNRKPHYRNIWGRLISNDDFIWPRIGERGMPGFLLPTGR